MPIERTGRFHWRLTGEHARKGAAVFVPLMLLFIAAAVAYLIALVYFTTLGVAALTGLPAVIVGLLWGVLSFQLKINGKRVALLPETAASAVNMLVLAVALIHYVQASSWLALLPGFALALALRGQLRKLRAPST